MHPNHRRGQKRKRVNPKPLAGALAAILAITASAALADPAVDWAKAQRVDLVEVDYAFQPNHLTFRRDRTYQLHVENRGHELHELTAPDFFKAVELRDPSVLNQDGTELVVKPGDQKDLYLVPLQPGRYGMRCADHDWAGMTGDITVD